MNITFSQMQITPQRLSAYNDLYGMNLGNGVLDQLLKDYTDMQAKYDVDRSGLKNFGYGHQIWYYTGVDAGKDKELKVCFYIGTNQNVSLFLISNRHPLFTKLPTKKLFITNYEMLEFNFLPTIQELEEVGKLTKTVGIKPFNRSPYKRPEERLKPVSFSSVAELSQIIDNELSSITDVRTILKADDFNGFISVIEVIERNFGIGNNDFSTKLKAMTAVAEPSSHNFMSKILEVLDVPKTNQRIAVLATPYTARSYGIVPKFYTFYVVNSDHNTYYYTDKDRVIFGDLGTSYRGHFNVFTPKLFLIENPAFIPDSKVYLEAVIQNTPRAQLPKMMNNEEIKKAIAVHAREQLRQDSAANREKERKNAMLQRMANVTETNAIKINDLEFFKDRIEYQGIKYSSDAISSTEILKNMLLSLGEGNINHDTFVEQFIARITSPKGAGVIKSVLADINVAYETKVTKDKDGTTTTRHYINGHRVNKSEVQDVVRQAICFTDDANYTAFADQVSKCSLKTHQFLSNGLDYTVSDIFQDKVWKLKIPLIRKKNKNYVNLQGHEHQVKNLNRLINMTDKVRMRGPISMDVFIDVLGNEAVLGIKDYKVLGDLIAKAKDAFAEAIKKSEELLKTTEKVLGIQLQTVNIGGRQKQGYVVKGTSGKEYFVDCADASKDRFHHAAYPVFHYPSGQAICIVDKASHRAQVGKDALVNRLFALKNDTFIAKEVHTLGLR